MSDLTPKQALFVKEYLVDLNGKQAAIRTGYSEASAEVQASRLLSNAKVASAVQAGMDKRAQKVEITAERVLAELALLAFQNPLDYVKVKDGRPYIDLSMLTREQAAAISEINVEELGGASDRPGYLPIVKTKLKFHDKRGALVDLGKHLKLFTDVTEHRFDLSNLSDDELKQLGSILSKVTNP